MEDDHSFAEKLVQKERAEEAVFFTKRDRALLEKLHDITDETQRRNLRQLTYLRCPDCGVRLERATRYGVTIDSCPEGHGLWLTEAEFHTLAKRERNSWIGRYLYRLKR
jgi:hypothetical protein